MKVQYTIFFRDQLAKGDRLEMLVHRDHKAIQVFLVHLDLQAFKEIQVSMDWREKMVVQVVGLVIFQIIFFWKELPFI